MLKQSVGEEEGGEGGGFSPTCFALPARTHNSKFCSVWFLVFLCVQGHIRRNNGLDVQGDVPFAPEVYVDGSYRPLCFANTNDNEVAAAVCLSAGFLHGGHFVARKTIGVFHRDATLVRAPPSPPPSQLILGLHFGPLLDLV